MTPWMILAAAAAPTGPRHSGSWTPPTGRASLGYEVAASTPPDLQNITLIALAVLVVLIVAVVLLLLFRNLSESGNYPNQYQRMQEDRAYLRTGLFNATGDILRETVRHRYGGGNNRL
jgi:hypothetical protein